MKQTIFGLKFTENMQVLYDGIRISKVEDF